MRHRPWPTLALPATLLTAGLWPLPAGAQTAASTSREPPTAAVAVLPVALYTAQANLQEGTDSTKAALATSVLLEKLGELLGDRLIAGDRVTTSMGSPGAARLTGNQPCNVIVACARFVGRELHAPWVVMAKVSKTSNLIWLFTGQLIHTSTGEILLDDSTELKGEPERMVRAGTRIFAERVARTVRSGGQVTNFPERD